MMDHITAPSPAKRIYCAVLYRNNSRSETNISIGTARMNEGNQINDESNTGSNRVETQWNYLSGANTILVVFYSYYIYPKVNIGKEM